MDLSFKVKPPPESAPIRRQLNYLVVMLNREAFFARKRGDYPMANSIWDLQQKAFDVIDKLESGAIDAAQARALIESHKNARENLKLIVDVMKMITADDRAIHAIKLISSK